MKIINLKETYICYVNASLQKVHLIFQMKFFKAFVLRNFICISKQNFNYFLAWKFQTVLTSPKEFYPIILQILP